MDKCPPSVQERKTGYVRALQKHGIQGTYIQPSGLNREAGNDALRQLRQDHPDITAIFACNDMSALGVLSGARELELNVPGHLSVIGFDNIDMAREVTPGLTTVHVHKTWLGAIGVRQLIERAATPEQPKMTVTLSTRLVIRESVGPPNHD
jgi:LacI family transcriptional regulator